jgi:metal-sulfur cluster biosynthetic enzyme
MVIYSIDAFSDMSLDIKQLRVKIFDELSKIVDPEINTSITDLELIDEVDINQSILSCSFWIQNMPRYSR